jgi:predicted transcriptional regulator
MPPPIPSTVHKPDHDPGNGENQQEKIKKDGGAGRSGCRDLFFKKIRRSFEYSRISVRIDKYLILFRRVYTMAGTGTITIYNQIREEIQTLFRSRLQTQIMLSLGEGKKQLYELRELTGSSSQAIIPKIRQLETAHYVESVGGEYMLTPLGNVVVPAMENLVRLLAIASKHNAFWAEHDLESIPISLLNDIGVLYNAEVVKDTDANIFNVYSQFLQIVNEASWIHGLSSVMSPTIANVIEQQVYAGTAVELVVSGDIVTQLQQEPFNQSMKKLSEHPNFTVLLARQPFKLGMTVTDRCLSLGLYKRNKSSYDTSTDLVSYDEKAIDWGEQLYQCYRDGAEKISF